MATALTDPTVVATQHCSCMTETPLEQVRMLTQKINLHQIRLQPHGIAVAKVFWALTGRRPSHSSTPGHDSLTVPINRLVEISRRGQGRTMILRQTTSPARSSTTRQQPWIGNVSPPEPTAQRGAESLPDRTELAIESATSRFTRSNSRIRARSSVVTPSRC